MTGDWGGARSDLESLGISPRGDFTSESAGNTSGGEEQTARSTEQIDFGADFALQRLLHIPNAKIQLTMTDRFGRSLSADAIGNQFAVQRVYGAGQNFRLAELNYQQDFLEHQLAIEVGWSPLGDQFAGISAFCNFQNGIICGHNNAMTNNSGAHNFPTAEWGPRIKLQATPDFYAMGGVYQVNPNEGNADNGWNMAVSTAPESSCRSKWVGRPTTSAAVDYRAPTRSGPITIPPLRRTYSQMSTDFPPV